MLEYKGRKIGDSPGKVRMKEKEMLEERGRVIGGLEEVVRELQEEKQDIIDSYLEKIAFLEEKVK